jgi:hypothetical protein
MVTLFGSLRQAFSAGPPSPEQPGSPVPAMVVMVPGAMLLTGD